MEVKVSDLIGKSLAELRNVLTGAKRGSILEGDYVMFESRNIVDLYLYALAFLAAGKGVDLVKVLPNQFNTTGAPTTIVSDMKPIDHTNIYARTHNSTAEKFYNLSKCFEELSKKESIDPYVFVIEY